MKSVTNTMCFDLAPINPNVNNIYYDIDSYKSAILNYISNLNNDVYSNYDNSVIRKVNTNKLEYIKIGKLININFATHSVDITLDDCYKFIKPEEYYIGFKFEATEEKDENKKLFFIEKVIYATIIPKIDIDEK